MAKAAVQEPQIEEQEEQKRPRLVPKLVAAPADNVPEPRRWPKALLELLRDPRWPVTLADFDLNKSTLSRHATKAEAGDENARKKLEPFKQFFLYIMGCDQHERHVYDSNNKPVTYDDPQNPGKLKIKTETRSKWGLRDQGRDMYHTAETGPRPRPAHWKRLVERYFYKLAPVLEILSPKLPKVQFGRRSPTLEAQQEALERVLDDGPDGARHEILKEVKRFLEGADSGWDGMQ